MPKKKEIYCPHYKEEENKKPVYLISLIDCNLNLCGRCYMRAIKEISEQQELGELLDD